MRSDNQNGKHEKPVVAVFDFDGTITDRHSFWRFLRLLVGPVRFWLIVLGMTPWIIRLYSGRTNVLAAREVLIRKIMKGLCADKVEALAKTFACEDIPKWVREDALDRIQWHKEKGHTLLLISNSAEDYLKPWANTLGFTAVYGTRFRVKDNQLTGVLDGTHCQGQEKVNQLTHHLGNLDAFEIHAYGDSDGDIELLNSADVSYYLTCDPELANFRKMPELPKQTIYN